MGNSFLRLESILEGETVFQNMKNMFAQPVSELYLCSAINELNQINEEFRTLNKKSFKAIIEAESKSEENNQFCEYFKEFKMIIDKFCNKINELASKSVINIENIVDTYKDLIEDDNLANSFSPFNMEVCKFRNLDDKEVPEFKVKKCFTKEFDNIGLLMQDLGPIASDEAKLKIIASVYNSLKKDMEEDFLEKCAEKLLDDEYDKKKSFSEQVYELFREGKEDKNISKVDIQEAKSVLMNYIKYTETIKSMAEKLVDDFMAIGNSMQNMIFQNKSCTMKIDTDTDGVINREYQLNTYSMNQFNIFMKTKTSQVSQIANMYMVAFSIKLDSIVDFINQNKDILAKAKDSCMITSTPDPEKDEEIDSMDDDMDIDDDNDGIEDEFDIEPEDPEIETGLEDNGDEIHEENPTQEADPSLEMESYIFEYELFNLENVFQQEMLKESFNMILEEEQGNNINNTAAAANDNSSKFTDIWRTVVEKLKQIFQKFYDMFVGHVSSRIKWLKSHEGEIKAASFANDAKIKNFNVDRIMKVNIPDLNYTGMKDDLVNKETFIKNEFINRYQISKKDDQSFSQALKDHFLPVKEDQTMPSGMKEIMYNFCVNQYSTLVADCQKQKNIIEKAQVNAKRIAGNIGSQNTSDSNVGNDSTKNNPSGSGDAGAKNESHVSTADMLYFNEFDEGTGTKSVKNDLMIYFSVCSSVLSIKMSTAQAAFNEFYRALSSLVSSNDKPENNVDNKNK